jgi:hypothetical protein
MTLAAGRPRNGSVDGFLGLNSSAIAWAVHNSCNQSGVSESQERSISGAAVSGRRIQRMVN